MNKQTPEMYKLLQENLETSIEIRKNSKNIERSAKFEACSAQ